MCIRDSIEGVDFVHEQLDVFIHLLQIRSLGRADFTGDHKVLAGQRLFQL